MESEPAGWPAPVGSGLGAHALRIETVAFRRKVNREGSRAPFEAGACRHGMAIETSAFRHFHRRPRMYWRRAALE